MAGLRQALRILIEASGPQAGELHALRMFAGPMAKTADHAALSRAQQMASTGASRGDIWRDTGWFQGVDGKWRFEIDDSGARLTGERYGSFNDVLDHPELFEAYPALRDVAAANEGAFRSSGSFQAEHQRPTGWGGVGGMRTERAHIDILGPNEGSRRSTALHEGQHGLQRTEGFALGGMPRMSDASPDLLARIAELETTLRQLNEVHWALRDPNRIREVSKELRALQRSARAEGHAVYEKLAGEVEARNVQSRRNFTPTQRRRRPPWTTQDTPDEQQIVRFDGDRAALREALANTLRATAGLGGLALAGDITLREAVRQRARQPRAHSLTA